MPVIKSENAPASAVPFSMADIEKAAKMILIRARQQADALLSAAQAAAQAQGEALRKEMHAKGLAEGRAQGHAEGYEEGIRQGHDQALAEHQQRLTELHGMLMEALGQIEANRREMEASALREIIELAVAIGRRVTKRQCMIDPGVLEANLAETMRLVVHKADLRIAINPAQRAVLEDALPRLGLQWPALEHAKLVEDETVAMGGCRVMTAHGEIDADIDGQLDRVIAELLPAANP